MGSIARDGRLILKFSLEKYGCENITLIPIFQDRVQWQALQNTVLIKCE